MKRIILVIAIIVASIFTSRAQQSGESLEQIASQINKQRVSFNYSFNPTKSPAQRMKGSVLVQKGCFKVTLNGVKIISNGKVTYTIDTLAKEVYIEQGVKVPSWVSNPKNITKSVNNVKATADSVSGQFINPDDKQSYDFLLNGLQISEPSANQDEFKFNPDSLGSDWVVTDMR